MLGLGDPVLPTWGKIIQDANANGALYRGYYYWILEPATLLMITGLGFAMLGFALDRVFNPKLRIYEFDSHKNFYRSKSWFYISRPTAELSRPWTGWTLSLIPTGPW